MRDDVASFEIARYKSNLQDTDIVSTCLKNYVLNYLIQSTAVHVIVEEDVVSTILSLYSKYWRLMSMSSIMYAPPAQPRQYSTSAL